MERNTPRYIGLIIAIVLLSIIMIVRQAELDTINVRIIFFVVADGIIFTICNITIFNRLMLVFYARKKRLKMIKVQSTLFSMIAIVSYLILTTVLILNPSDKELLSTTIFLPLVTSIFLQNVVYSGEEKLIFFNISIDTSRIKKVKIEKSILRTFVISIFLDNTEQPKVITISKKYLANFYAVINIKNIEVEFKGVEIGKIP